MVRPVCTTTLTPLRSKPSRARHLVYKLGAVMAFLAIGGCGDKMTDVPATVPVTGTITLNGSPLPDADVMFFDGSQFTPFGKTDGTGRFSLKTRFNSVVTSEGAPVREYRVTVSKMVPPKGMTEEDYEAKRQALEQKTKDGQIITPADQVPPKVEIIPPRYSQADQTVLKFLVKVNQNNDVPFALEK